MIKVSVIIPVYNAETYIEQCLDSVLCQTLRDIEVICVDDDSRDHSLEILQTYANRDARVKVIQQENLHAGVARNRGMAEAAGEWIAFVDSDDFCEPDGLEKLYRMAEAHSLDFLKCSSFVYDETKKRYVKNQGYYTNDVARDILNQVVCFEEHPDILLHIADVPWNGLYNASFIRRNHVVFPDFWCVNDHLFFSQCLLYAKRMMVTDVPFIHHRIDRAGSLIHTKAYHFDAQISNYYGERSLAKSAFDGKYARLILQNALGSVFGWYKRLLGGKINQAGINAAMFRFIETYDAADVGEDYLRTFPHASMYAFIRRLAKTKSNIEETVLLDNRSSDSTPYVSVIVPVYNTAPWLQECLKSLIGQTLRNIEIICVNDGATDGSLDILKDYASIDSRIVVITQENLGQATARNTGVRHARGQYLFLCSSEDYMKDNSLQRGYDLCETKALDMAVFPVEVRGDSKAREQEVSDKIIYDPPAHRYEGIRSGKELCEAMLKTGESMAVHWVSFIKRSYFLDNELWQNPGIVYADTLHLWKWLYFAPKAAYIPEAVCCRPYRGSLATVKGTFSQAYDYFLCMEEWAAMIRSGTIVSDDHELIRRQLQVWTNQLGNIYWSLSKTVKDMVYVLPLQEQLAFRVLADNARCSQLAKENARNKKLLQDIRSGYSFRIGRVITFVPRKIRGGIRCYKEHGFCYTAKRVLFHLKCF